VIYHKAHKDLRKEPKVFSAFIVHACFKVVVLYHKAHKDLRKEPKIQHRARVLPIDLFQNHQ